MEQRVVDLAKYRLERSKEMLHDSEIAYLEKGYRTSLNRSYYAIFHAMRVVNCFDEFDSKKHAGVLAHFNQYFIKTGKLDMSLSKIAQKAKRLREQSDYEDFFLVSKEEARTQLEQAKVFVKEIENYTKTCLNGQ